MIHIYHGNGKGKTTAAFGLSARAVENGYKVIIAQFLKARRSGEYDLFSKMDNVITMRADIGPAFSWEMTPEQKVTARIEHDKLFKKIVYAAQDGKLLVILDEIIDAINEKLISVDIVLDFLRLNKDEMEIVLTGRNPQDELIELADYVTEMKCIKHPFEKGTPMRKGIEF